MTRPISVSILGWIQLLGAIIDIIAAPIVLSNSVSLNVIQGWGASPVVVASLSLFAAAFNSATGLFLLRGNRLGRQAYLIGTPLITLTTLLLYHFRFIQFYAVNLLFYGVFAVLLTRRAANEFFSGNPTSDILTDLQSRSAVSKPSPSLGRRVAAVLLLIPGGFFLMSWFMVILPLSSTLLSLSITSFIFIVLSSIFVVPGIFLWDRRDWPLTLGVLFTCVGAFSLLGSGMIAMIQTMPEFQDQLAKSDPTILHQVIIGTVLSGVTSLGCGIGLILYHRGRRIKEGHNAPFNLI